MGIGVLFWVIFLIALLFGGYGVYAPAAWPGVRWGPLIVVVLVGILGWRVFGPAVHP